MLPITPAAKPGTTTASQFQQTCGVCGCVFRVEMSWSIGNSYRADQNTQDYACPGCQRVSRIKTSTQPLVFLISKGSKG